MPAVGARRHPVGLQPALQQPAAVQECFDEALTEEAASIAAEQRTVRANFIFLLGGHVEGDPQPCGARPRVQVRADPVESVVAEKLYAMVTLGEANTPATSCDRTSGTRA